MEETTTPVKPDLRARLVERKKQLEQAMGHANFLAGQVQELELLVALVAEVEGTNGSRVPARSE